MKNPTALLFIGGNPATITVAKDAIVEVLKAAGTEASCVAAMTTLAELARAPTNTTISDCSFVGSPPEATKRR